jgi:pSer/pThr/pTyr-binding forkhead associated (FHA) protein
MVTAVRLTVLTGAHKDRRFCFCGPTQCQMGRALDCFIQLSGTGRDQLISRHHCQLDVDLPSVQIRDLGSKNGTCVNGIVVDSSLKELSEKAGFVLNHGDLINLGGTTLRVDILDCPHTGNESEGKSIWQAGETQKKDCPLPC